MEWKTYEGIKKDKRLAWEELKKAKELLIKDQIDLNIYSEKYHVFIEKQALERRAKQNFSKSLYMGFYV